MPIRRPAPRRRVVFFVPQRFVLLDLAGPWEVFHLANLLSDAPHAPPYAIELVAVGDDREVQALGGPTLLVSRRASRDRREIDTLVVPAFDGCVDARPGTQLIRSVRRLAARARRVVGVCAGAFVLAHAGLLAGRRATTHWRECDRLRRDFPDVVVDADAIFVRDEHVYTSAGVTAGIDLALSLIEEDLGRDASLAVARHLVVFLRRPGGQAQFSATLDAQAVERDALGALIVWLADHLHANTSVEALAARANMSPRNFARVFRREVGQTPARYVERLRVEAARRQLEESAASIEAISVQCGFRSLSAMRRAFSKTLGVAPSSYRSRFQPVAVTVARNRPASRAAADARGQATPDGRRRARR